MLPERVEKACRQIQCCLALTLAGAFATGEVAAQSQPNVVIVNIDDFGWGDLGSYGSDYSQTPNLDQLAGQGVRFTQFYSGAPICSPSRAALLTGQYAARSGVNSFLNDSTSNLQRDNADSLSISAPSMARAFQESGYATGHFGKWHLGGGRDVGYAINPTPGTNVSAPRIVEYGYDEAWTQFEGLANRIINVVDYGGTAAGTSTRPSAYFNGLNQQSDARGTGGGLDQIVYLERQYNATFMVDRAMQFIDDTKGADPAKPFFMNVWLDESHTPHDPPSSFKTKYDSLYPNLPAETRGYLAVVEYADQQIGRLIDHIDQKGLGDDTIILVMADNGPTGVNANNIDSNGPFRGTKGDLFEGGSREPLIVRWTGKTAAGRTDDDTVLWSPDLFPTLAEVTGVAAPAGVDFDGESMSAALLGAQSQTRATPLFWNMNRGTENRHVNPDPTGAGANGQEVVALRSGNWKLLLNAQGTAPALYDLASDPGEANNLAVQQPALVEQLASQALAIRYSTPSRTLPDSVAPLVQLKAQDLAALGNGAAVARWADAATGDSFNGSVSQVASGSQPRVATAALNDRAAIVFDGDDVLLSLTTNSLPAPSEGVTVIAVTTADARGNPAQRLGQLGDSGGAFGGVAGFDVSSSSTATNNGGAGLRFNNGASLYDTPLAEAGFHIVVWQVDGDQAYADAKLFVDGTLSANTFSGAGSAAATASFSGNDLELLLGTGRAANGELLGGDYFTGQLAEFLVFNEQLSTGQINLVANYLSSEYGLPFAFDTTLDLFDVHGLSWTGGSDNFDAAWNAGDGGGGPADSNSNPFTDGVQDLFLGNDGVAMFNDATDVSAGSRVNSLRVGTAHSGFVVDGTAGNGALIATGSRSLVIGNGSPPVGDADTGNLTVGEAGFAGTFQWSSSGTLKIEGRLRIGQGGAGVFIQNDGVVTAGDIGGSLKFIGIGAGAGSNGTYELNNGRFLPGGGLAGSQLRQLRIGHNLGTGAMTVGDGTGAAGSASIETPDDIFIGYEGGNGTLTIESDGAITLEGSGAELHVANGNGSTGLVVQHGGAMRTEGLVTIGQGAGAAGEYRLHGGALFAAEAIRIGGGGGEGSLLIENNASLVSTNNLFLGQSDNAGSKGLLELSGSEATLQIARLENQRGNDETIRWIADAGGVSPIVIKGSGGADRVQLQDPVEAAANSGVNGAGNLNGDGIALALDLSALSHSQTLLLVDNRTSHAVTGFFERAATGDLHEEGEFILGTSFQGSVSISYVGGTGNDVVLNLIADAAASADFDGDGDVDGADFLTWQRGFGASGSGDSDGNGAVDAADLAIWRDQFGATADAVLRHGVVPEPASFRVLMTAALALWRLRGSLQTPLRLIKLERWSDS